MIRALPLAVLTMLIASGSVQNQGVTPPCPNAQETYDAALKFDTECFGNEWYVRYNRLYICPNAEEPIDARKLVPGPWQPTGHSCSESSGVTMGDYFARVLGPDTVPQSANAVPAADVDPGVQKMVIESVADDLQPVLVISDLRQPTDRRWGRGLWNALRQLVRPARQPSSALLTAADAGFRRDRGRSRGVWLAPIAGPVQAQEAQTPAGPPPIRMLVTSLGTSTGEAFQAAIVNDGDKPVLIDGMRLVLEPLKSDTARRARSAIQKFRAEKPTTVKMTGYCLEFLRPPPIAGTLFRIAPQAAQEAAGPVRRILEAGSRLRRQGRLNPDSEPTGYYHAIRQWAIWTQEQGFTEETFTNAFVEHTKKTLVASGRQWSAAAEQTLRQAAPGRWRDIQEVLAAAAQAR